MQDRPGRSPHFAPLRRSDLLGAGVRRRELDQGLFTRVIHDMWVPADTPIDLWTRIAAVSAKYGSATVVSHATAAQFYGLPVPDDCEIHITVPRTRARPKVEGVRPHLPRIAPRTHVVDGVRVTTPEQTFLDLARPLTLVDLVVLGDAMVTKGLTTPTRLIKAAREWRGHGATLARRAVKYVRAGVESPPESRLRMLVVLAGLPEPEINCSIHDQQGHFLARYDLSYRRWRLALEYDGRQHAFYKRQWKHDLRRRERADAAGWRHIVVTHEDLFVSPGQTLARIIDAMRAAGMPIPRSSRSMEWRAHFPGR